MKDSKHSEVLRNLPGIDKLLSTETATRLVGEAGVRHLTGMSRLVTDELRSELRHAIETDADVDISEYSAENLLAEAECRLDDAWKEEQRQSLKPVINATGVIIHTNLGRAPLTKNARAALAGFAGGYCNLEYNVSNGKRGKRGAYAEKVLADITGAESALIVNNCASACVLVLTALAQGGESVISRGELVEIGGDFRVPDVMNVSGTDLVEVGTTNKTKLADYENALTEDTRLIVRVHPSNYRIVGFTSKPSVADLARLAHRNDVLLYEDAGSGAMEDFTPIGLTDEPIIPKSVSDGADVVTFSADKLIGGIQAGLIVGRNDVIARIRRHPLYRALRVSKLVYAVLESTFEHFRKGDADEQVPVLRMLKMSAEDVKDNALEFVKLLTEQLGDESPYSFQVGTGRSVVGGGSAPASQPRTTLLAVTHEDLSSAKLEEKLREHSTPVVCRVFDDRVALDFRTIQPEEVEQLVKVFAGIAQLEK